MGKESETVLHMNYFGYTYILLIEKYVDTVRHVCPSIERKSF